MWFCIALIILGACALVFYLIEKIKNYSVKSVLLKFFVSLLFVAVAVISSFYKSNHILNPFIIIGLILGLSGDIWLDLKYVYPKDDKIYTYAGFIVFALGHVLFILGMHLEFSSSLSLLYIFIPVLISLVMGVVNLLLAKPLKLEFKDMKAMVYVYSVLLFSTPLTALGLCFAYSWSNITLIMLFVGGILFAISDLVLSGTYFGKNHEKAIDFILNYIPYYSAQFVIAFSIFFL